MNDASRPYHHGDLRPALLRAAETILERDGIQALTLRAAARAVGVSHAAPTNHFGDLTGLLSELAAIGYARFTARLAAAMDAAMDGAGDAPAERRRAMGRAYVGFARAHPGLFVLMFRSERLDVGRPALRAAIEAARDQLRQAVAQGSTAPDSAPQAMAQAAALWSLVHGFAVLLLDGRLDAMLATLPEGAGVETLLDAVFATTAVGQV